MTGLKGVSALLGASLALSLMLGGAMVHFGFADSVESQCVASTPIREAECITPTPLAR